MKHRGHKCTFFLLAACLLLTTLLMLTVSASAGDVRLDVATEGKGVTVYTSATGSGKAGILYNGYYKGLIGWEEINGRNECMLTRSYSVWVNVDKAFSLWPEEIVDPDEWDKTRPCSVFLGEITKDNTPVYTTPKNKREKVRHLKGTLVIVCGEFGNDYYVDGPAEGFISKNAVSKVKDLTPEQGRTGRDIFDDLRKETVYASKSEPAYFSASAGGYNEEETGYGITEKREYGILRDLGDWVQLDNFRFVEKRFLDPDAAHSYPTAWVKCDGQLDRLNVREAADTDSETVVKLCSGVPVHVVTQTKDWAEIYVTGPNGGKMEYGFVMKKHLSFDGKDVKYDGCTQVRLKENVNGIIKEGVFYGWQGNDVLPEGTLLTVVGVYTAYMSTASSTADFLCETEDGQYFKIHGEYRVEPVKTETGIYAKARSDVRMRKSPDEDGDVLHEVKAKTKVEVLLRGEIWTVVKYKDEIGYMMSRYLSFP